MTLVDEQLLTYGRCVGSFSTRCIVCLSLIADFTCTSASFSCIALVPLIVVRMHVYVISIAVMKPYTLIGRMQKQNQNRAALFCCLPCTFINAIHESAAVRYWHGSSWLDAWASKLLTCRIPQAYYSGLTLTREQLYCTIHFLCACLELL